MPVPGEQLVGFVPFTKEPDMMGVDAQPIVSKGVGLDRLTGFTGIAEMKLNDVRRMKSIPMKILIAILVFRPGHHRSTALELVTDCSVRTMFLTDLDWNFRKRVECVKFLPPYLTLSVRTGRLQMIPFLRS